MLCGFRFELEFHTTNSLRECYNVTRDFCYNSQGVCIKKYITPEEYIAHLMDVVGDAKNNYLTSGTNAGAWQLGTTSVQNKVCYGNYHMCQGDCVP